jgi:hypothetical protein
MPKYLSNLQRPVAYIQDNIDGTRLPYNVTQSFPTSTSGHSTLSGAAIAVLTAMFGVHAFTDTTHTDHGLRPHTFNSIGEAAEEATVSRLYKYIRSRPPCVSLGRLCPVRAGLPPSIRVWHSCRLARR